MGTRLLHLKEVLNRTSLSRSSVYRQMSLGTFPASVPLGARRAWISSEIDDWIAARIAERIAA